MQLLSFLEGVSSQGDGAGAAGANGGDLCHHRVPPHVAATAERSAMVNKCGMIPTLFVRVLCSSC